MISVDLMKKAALFAGGVLFGTAGVKILSSKDAKKAYVQATAAVLSVPPRPRLRSTITPKNSALTSAPEIMRKS